MRSAGIQTMSLDGTESGRFILLLFFRDISCLYNGQKEGHDMITLTLSLLAVLLIIAVAICFIIASPIAIIMLLALLLDVAVLGGIFGRRRNKKED